MKKKDVLRLYGTEAAVADALGISRQAVHKWGKIVPFRRAIKLQGKGLPLCLKDYQ